ncbi:hypothetical protein G6L28_13455 [Agrobacterium larrymoorei]|uniref:rhamnan synthesis F family protein n=1 Tax=Agrobacterium larrymoorei TaxID=160699 RepID=UPI001573FD40|nr:rhamnan synthesis F family protein [Agrobacterium larrymoorei]NTJ43607.1 hypothetical protein [Agrobacterium larrymoorei]
MWTIPNWLFDGDWYQGRYADAIPSNITPKDHYDQLGARSGYSPHPLFDAAWYCKKHPWALTNGMTAAEHYVTIGSAKGYWPHPLFDTGFYKKNHRNDLIGDTDPLEHFLTLGEALGYAPHELFDTSYYRRKHAADPVASARPFRHYLAHGHLEGFDPNPYFDTGWYAREHAIGERNALEHYVDIGERLRLSPHPLWDEKLHLDRNEKLRKVVASNLVASGYRHFVIEGAALAEADKAPFLFTMDEHLYGYNAKAYLEDNPEAAIAVRSGQYRTGLAHLFNEGLSAFRKEGKPFYGEKRDVTLVDQLAGNTHAKGKYLCLFAHFDRHDIIDPYVITYLKALQDAGTDIVFVTPTRNEAELKKVLPYVRHVFVKLNNGHDFGSWWLALSQLGADCGEHYERVFFANDSIYFPVRPMQPFFDAVERQTSNIYGLSDNHEIAHHVQSYFLSFDSEAQKKLFPVFMESFAKAHMLPKSEIIQRYEIGLSLMAQDLGLTIDAYYSCRVGFSRSMNDPKLARWKDFLTERAGVCNSSIILWDMLIEHFDWPALKVAFLTTGIPLSRERSRELPRLIADGEQKIHDLVNHQRRIAS